MATYYVDATGGNDGDPGTSEGTAWQTIGKVNASTFNFGDSVLFKRGETWTMPAAITGTTGVTYADYGSGAKPILDGNDLQNVFYVTNKNTITLQNLDLRNGFDFCAWFDTCHTINVLDCDMNRAGNDCLNFFDGSYNCRVKGGIFENAYERVAGPSPSGIEVADGSHDIVIDSVECRGATGTASAGITIHSHVATAMPYNVEVIEAYCHDNGNYGIVVFNQNGNAGAGANLNITFSNCLIVNNTLDQIRVTKGAAITEYPAVISFDRCFVNASGCRYAVWNEGDTCTYRHCIFHEGRMFYSRSSVGLAIYNCTFYLTTWAGYRPFTHDDASARGNTTILLRNNLIYMPDTAGSSIFGVLAGATAGADINYTLYQMSAASNRWNWGGVIVNFAGWLAAGPDANGACIASALFIDAANDNFYLQHGSPALNVGTPIAGMPFYGTAPDCGRWEMRWLSQKTYQLRIPAWRFT